MDEWKPAEAKPLDIIKILNVAFYASFIANLLSIVVGIICALVAYGIGVSSLLLIVFAGCLPIISVYTSFSFFRKGEFKGSKSFFGDIVLVPILLFGIVLPSYLYMDVSETVLVPFRFFASVLLYSIILSNILIIIKKRLYSYSTPKAFRFWDELDEHYGLASCSRLRGIANLAIGVGFTTLIYSIVGKATLIFIASKGIIADNTFGEVLLFIVLLLCLSGYIHSFPFCFKLGKHCALHALPILPFALITVGLALGLAFLVGIVIPAIIIVFLPIFFSIISCVYFAVNDIMAIIDNEKYEDLACDIQIIFFIIVVVGGIIALQINTANQTEFQRQERMHSQEISQKAEEIFAETHYGGIGNTLSVDDFDVSLKEAQILETSGSKAALIIFYFDVTNNSDEIKEFMSKNFIGKSGEKSYKPILGRGVVNKTDIFSGNINAGRTKSGYVAFRIPTSLDAFDVNYSDIKFSVSVDQIVHIEE